MPADLQHEIEAAERRMLRQLLKIVEMEQAGNINDKTAAILRRQAQIDLEGAVGFEHLVRDGV